MSKKMLLAAAIAAAAIVVSFIVTNSALAQVRDTRPNIVIFLADDAGFSDFLAGEVDTPNVDSLADNGMMLTQFRTMPTCSPTRAILLTGTDNHINGLGQMQGSIGVGNPQTGFPGYEGYLNKNVVTVATLLKDADYHTYMVGKWHLGIEEDVDGGQVVFPRGWWPIDRGFEKAAGMLEGGGEHWGSCERAEGHCTRFFEGDTLVTTQLGPDYFSAEYHTDKALQYIDEGIAEDAGDRKPFFLYYSDTLVHEPNQVPSEYINDALVTEIYNKGWDTLRGERLAELKTMGIISNSVSLPARFSNVPDWDNESDPIWTAPQPPALDQYMSYYTDTNYAHVWDIETVDDLKWSLAKRFVAYLGMVSYFDNEVGRIMDHIDSVGEGDNTIYIFFSDNGGDARPWDWLDRDMLSRKGTDNSLSNIGSKNSFVSNGQGWAQVSNTPLDTAKIAVGDGGIRSPLMIYDTRTAAGRAGARSSAFATVMDITPTILDYAGVTHPVGVGVAPDKSACTGTFNGLTDICPMNGKSLRPILEGTATHVHMGEPISLEMFGAINHSLFIEEADALYKIRRVGVPAWRLGGFPQNFSLYNLTEDPTESTDLAASNPEKLAEMVEMHMDYLGRVGWVPFGAPFGARFTENIAPSETARIEMPITNNGDTQDTYTIKCLGAWECTVGIQVGRVPTDDSMSVTLNAGASVTATIDVTAPNNALDGDKNQTQVVVLSENNPAVPTHLTYLTVVEGAPTALTSSLIGLMSNNRQAVFLTVALLVFVTAAARAWDVKLTPKSRD